MPEIEKKKSIKKMIATASGTQLFRFMKEIRNGNRFGSNTRKYFKLIMKRARELNQENYGSWEEAKMRLNQLPYPTGIFETSKELLPILGYSVYFQNYPKTKSLAIINPKLNCAYIRDLMGNYSEDDEQTKVARSIFNS